MYTQARTAVDLTICTPKLAQLTNWLVEHESTLDNDHFPIIISLQMTVQQNPIEVPLRWKYSKAHWEHVKYYLSNRNTNEIEHPDIITCKNNITKAIHEAAVLIVKLVPNTSGGKQIQELRKNLISLEEHEEYTKPPDQAHWTVPKPRINTKATELGNKLKQELKLKSIFAIIIQDTYSSFVKIYTDVSKTTEPTRTASTIVIQSTTYKWEPDLRITSLIIHHKSDIS
ncbi:hypothetical protein CHS0354_021866 [Potamilus streckersoni]|uniref:Endonuclease/exonuclease/phosphatase domain-containing protein n=1 Tax=Potamilus streckersoni TaxID=2493646 RepID=A0AAE0TKG2_9BIVA|nr:hypothetical protein CHS0354_021866 [Potamilus streckersoni]